MHKNVKFEELIKLAKRHMEEQGFTDVSTFRYLRTWRSAYNFALSRGIEYFSADLAETFMREKYGFSIGEDSADKIKLSPYAVQNVRAMRALVDFLLHGFVPKDLTERATRVWPEGFRDICQDFVEEYRRRGYAEATCHGHETDLYRFVDFLGTRGIHEPKDIDIQNVYDYFPTLCHLAKSTLYGVRGTIVKALKFFYERDVCQSDLSEFVPKVCYYSRAKLSKIWNEDEIAQMLSVIDRANPLGRRDYAIMLIAANLGLRISDIVNLSMEDFDWLQGTINIIQEKTGESLTLPISENVGKAVIDYWRNGRPKTIAPELFVQHTLPYQRINKTLLYHIFNQYLITADVYLPDGKKHGLHSLRHSLASRLLEKDTPVNVIGNILGHVDSNSASYYIRIDIEKLRRCALEVPSVEQL
jgi:site-specific recombinase XerD